MVSVFASNRCYWHMSICYWQLTQIEMLLTDLLGGWQPCVCDVLESNVHNTCLLYFCICSVQLNMFYMEKHYRNKFMNIFNIITSIATSMQCGCVVCANVQAHLCKKKKKRKKGKRKEETSICLYIIVLVFVHVCVYVRICVCECITKKKSIHWMSHIQWHTITKKLLSMSAKRQYPKVCSW